MHAEFSKITTASHASLGLINYKQPDESLTAFIYSWGELLGQCCGIYSDDVGTNLR